MHKFLPTWKDNELDLKHHRSLAQQNRVLMDLAFRSRSCKGDAIERLKTIIRYDDFYPPNEIELVYLISSLDKGLDEYVKWSRVFKKSISAAVIHGVVIRMKNDDKNDPFWKQIVESGELLALHKAVVDTNFDKIKDLINNSPPSFRLMLDYPSEDKTCYTNKTPLHLLVQSTEISDDDKIKVCKLFIEDGKDKLQLSDFVDTLKIDLLSAAIKSSGVPFLKFLLDESIFNFYEALDVCSCYKVNEKNVDEVEFLFDKSGRNIGEFTHHCIEICEKTESMYEQAYGDNDSMDFLKQLFFEVRKRDMLRLLYIIHDNKYISQQMHFVEDVVQRTMVIWISLQDSVRPKKYRTLRDSVPGFDYHQETYNPTFDFRDPKNPELERVMMRKELLERDYDDETVFDASDDELFEMLLTVEEPF